MSSGGTAACLAQDMRVKCVTMQNAKIKSKFHVNINVQLKYSCKTYMNMKLCISFFLSVSRFWRNLFVGQIGITMSVGGWLSSP